MYTQHITNEPSYIDAIPMMDAEFDRFEINNELEVQLRQAEAANFYHDALNGEE